VSARQAAEQVLEDARAICAVPAPPFGEGPRGEFVGRLFEQAGAPTNRDQAGNVVASLGGGPPHAAIVFAAHMDTVFEAGTEISFRSEPGRLAAPGLGDNSLGVAALLHLARHLLAARPRRPVHLVATVGEEGLGDLRGAKALLQERRCDAFVAVEGQALDTITVAGVGSQRFRVSVRGPGGHPWGDRGTPSAIHGLIECLNGFLTGARSPATAVNVGVIRGGTVINAIAGEASADVDLRSAEAADLHRATEQFRGRLDRLPAGLDYELEPLGSRPAGRIEPDHELLLAARRARAAAGLPPAREDASSTDANAAYGLGIPAITVGVSTGGNAHRLSEYIDLDPLPGGLASLAALADELAGEQGRRSPWTS
jgi:tripeptide aminopeptidase